MSEFTYNYTSADFPNGLNTTKLQSEITASTISTTLLRIDTEGDNPTMNIYVVFAAELSPADFSTLTTVISNHNGNVPPTPTSRVILATRTNIYKSNVWDRAIAFHYDSDINKSITAIEAYSCMVNGITSYDIRVYNATANEVIVEATFTNTEYQTVNLGTISNMPLTHSDIDVLVRVNGGLGKNVYVDTITFYLV